MVENSNTKLVATHDVPYFRQDHRVQGWGSGAGVCRGGDRYVRGRGWSGARMGVGMLLGRGILGFKVSKFVSFKVSKIFNVFRRYLFHISEFPFHVIL